MSGRRRPASPRVTNVEELMRPPSMSTADFDAAEDTALSHSKTEVNVIVLGKDGSGKSALINALRGAREDMDGKSEDYLPAEENDTLSSKPQEVTPHKAQRAVYRDKLYTITLWDTPGLMDGKRKEQEYMQQIQRKCGEIDILLYCINCSLTRCVLSDMVPGMKVVTEHLGPDIWRHAMIVLTFANFLEENIEDEPSPRPDTVRHTFALRIDYWKSQVGLALIDGGAPQEVIGDIQIELAGHLQDPRLPDRPHWLGYLWLRFYSSTRVEAMLPLIINNQHRIRHANDLTPAEQQGTGDEVPIVVDEEELNNMKFWARFGGFFGHVGGIAAGGGVAGKAAIAAGLTTKAAVGVGVGAAMGWG